MIKLVFQALTVLFALAGGMTAAAGADGNNGNGSSNRSDKAEKSDNKNDSPNKPDKPDTPNKPDKSTSPPKANVPRGPKDVLPPTSQDAQIVLPEVMIEQALSLSEVRMALARISNGRMLDISLGQIDGRLVYRVTVLEAGNIARLILIDAKSGLEVGDPR